MTGLLATRAQDADLLTPDSSLIAQSLLASAKKLKKSAPSQMDLADAIATVNLTSPIQGAPSIVLQLLDPLWHLLDSTFFDADQDGRLDPLQLVYPEGRYTWILSQVSPSGAAHTMDVTFVPKVVYDLQHKYGPKKANRSSTTRAEFIRSLVNEVGGRLYCKQLDKTQPIGAGQASSAPSSAQADDQAHKTNGIGKNTKGLTCAGSKLSKAQIRVINLALGAAEQAGASKIVTEALIYAGMGETLLGDYPGTYGGGPSVGVWQGFPSDYGDGRDIAKQALAFLQGGPSFKGSGGAIHVAQINPHYQVWQIANDTERNKLWNDSKQDSYAHQFSGGTSTGQAEATAIVEAGGVNGLSGGSFEEVQPYYFTVGGSSNPHESYWDAIQRLAQEVGWTLFVDGSRLYYDSQMTLIKQVCAAQLDRDDLEIIDWSYDWETRQIATQFSLTAMCEPFGFHAGDVFKLENFGTASQASTAALPGRWLVSNIARDMSALSSQFTLVQPVAPTKEPAPEVKSVDTTSGNPTMADIQALKNQNPATAPAAVAAAKYLSNLKVPYAKYDRDVTRNLAPEAGKPYDGQHGLDCSASVSWVLNAAGFPLPGSAKSAPASGAYESWGLPGKGKQMTIWTSPGHIFLEFNVDGHMQGNTSGPQGGGAGFRYFKWGGAGAADAQSFTARHWKGC